MPDQYDQTDSDDEGKDITYNIQGRSEARTFLALAHSA
jgi:hypothetical protein